MRRTARGVINLVGREIIKGEGFEITTGFDDIVWEDENGEPTTPPA
jgi:hypothetical protein